MRNRALFVLLSGLLLLGGYSSAQQFHYQAIDVQCAAGTDPSACPTGLAPGQTASQTSAKGVNASGDIVGVYVAGKSHGFLLKDGQFTTIDFPGQFPTVGGVLSGVRATSANGINPQGDIVGQYTLPVNDPNGPPISEDSPLYCPPDLKPPAGSGADPACIKGFFYRHGKFSTVMFPGHPGAIAQRITPDDDIYGCLHDHDLGMSMFGAAWNRFDTASLTMNGGERTDGMAIPMSMNNGATVGAHSIGGLWVDMKNQQHGFLVQDGVFQSYDPTSTTVVTAIWDMAPDQQFVGTYVDRGKRHGFLQSPPGPDGSIAPATNLDFTCQDTAGCDGIAFGGVAFATIAFGINPSGIIVGQFTLVNGGAAHGFAAVPVPNN